MITVHALLATAGLPCLLILSFCVPQLGDVRTLLLINYLAVLGATLTPTWYFQGIERQSTLSGITVAVRIASIPAVFLLVRSSSDTPVAVLINSAATVICGLLCLAFLWRTGHLDRARVDRAQLVAALKDGWHLFVSTCFESVYTRQPTPLCSAWYPMAPPWASMGPPEKINPSVPKPVGTDQSSHLSAGFKADAGVALGGVRAHTESPSNSGEAQPSHCSISLVRARFIPVLVRILYGSKEFGGQQPSYAGSRRLPFLVGLSNVFGVQTLLAMGMNKLVSRILVTAGLINVAFLVVLTHWFAAVGAAIAVAATELLVTVVMAMAMVRLDLPVFGFRWQPRVAP